MWWLLTSNASVPLAAKPLGDGRSWYTNTQGFSYWLDGMPVHSTCCLIVLIVFVSPPKANTKNVPCMIVWISDQWRGTGFAADGCACCIEGFTRARNDPWTVPITVSPHDIYDIASLHKDNPFQRRCCQGAARCFCISLRFIWSSYSINTHLVILHQFVLPPYPTQDSGGADIQRNGNISCFHCRRFKLLGGWGCWG